MDNRKFSFFSNFFRSFRAPLLKFNFLAIGLVFLIILGGFLFLSGEAMAADCGDTTLNGETDTICACGNTVVGSAGYTYTLPGDLTCTGHGLFFGASNITIDGNGHTITGDEGNSDYGIYNDGFDYATTTNFTITNFGRGIFMRGENAHCEGDEFSMCEFFMSEGECVQFPECTWITENNKLQNNIITDNTVNSNFKGIYLDYAFNNTLTGNTVNSNSQHGIYLTSSGDNTLTGNTMSDNAYNLDVLTDFNNIIDITNLVESKPVYYLYNQNGTAESPLVYDGNILGDIGIFWAIDCEHIEVKNAVLSANNNFGVYFNNTTFSTIENIAVSNSLYGIHLKSSSSNTLVGNTVNSNSLGIYLSSSNTNTLTDNTANSNSQGIYLISSGNNTLTGNTANFNSQYGIYLRSSSNNTLISNTANSNSEYGIHFYFSNTNTLTGNTANSNSQYGIYLKSSSNNTLTSNTANSNSKYGIYFSDSSNTNTLTSNIISNNINDIYDNGTTNIYSLNQILHNVNNKMLTWAETSRIKNINGTVNFSFSMFDIQGDACPDCNYSVAVYPNKTITVNPPSDNNITGNFTVTQNGTYSLEVQVTDADDNFTKRKFVFLVGDTDSKTIRYYLRDADPIHGQPRMPYPHKDSKAMLLTPPTEDEWWYCNMWVQNSPDELPPAYTLGNLDSINIHSWYKSDADGYIGVQKFATYNITVNQRQNISAISTYASSTNNFNLDWMMDYQSQWYWTSLKLKGSNPYWRSTPSQPSYADFTYSYTTSPAIKSNSNEDIIILSATATSSISSITLENPTSATTTTNLTLTDFNYPFLNATSTINSNATTTITTPSIGVRATTTIDSLNIPITPASGSVEVLATGSLIDLDYHNSTLTGLTINNIDREINLNNQDSASMIITLPSGSIDLTIDSWLTSGTYNKQWTATSTTATSTIYTIGDLKANTYYEFKLDGTASTTAITNDAICNNGMCLSDENGQIIFTYTGGYSAHTFGLEEGDNTAPELSAGSPNSALSAGTANATLSLTTNETATCKYSTTQNTVYSSMTAFSNTDNTTHSTPITGLTNGTSYNYYIKCQDAVGNVNSSDYAISFSVSSAGGGMPFWMLNQINQNQNQGENDAEENNNGDEAIDSRLRGNDNKKNLFAYSQPRLKSLPQEQNSAKELKQKLEEFYSKGKIPVHKKHWHTIVNSYIYGNYPITAIIKAIKFGGKTVHPIIPFSAWQKAKDYLEWIGR